MSTEKWQERNPFILSLQERAFFLHLLLVHDQLLAELLSLLSRIPGDRKLTMHDGRRMITEARQRHMTTAPQFAAIEALFIAHGRPRIARVITKGQILSSVVKAAPPAFTVHARSERFDATLLAATLAGTTMEVALEYSPEPEELKNMIAAGGSPTPPAQRSGAR